jgi:hypothetical protein
MFISPLVFCFMLQGQSRDCPCGDSLSSLRAIGKPWDGKVGVKRLTHSLVATIALLSGLRTHFLVIGENHRRE